MNILVISPHPDDEVLGMGGTIKKLSKKNRIILCVVASRY
jgi:LmbE family N-acetylglucosaminyl deacetylase